MSNGMRLCKGKELDNVGYIVGVYRRPMESDKKYRSRIVKKIMCNGYGGDGITPYGRQDLDRFAAEHNISKRRWYEIGQMFRNRVVKTIDRRRLNDPTWR